MLKTVSAITNAIGALNYKGTWNATTNTPALASGVGTKGDYYQVSVAGSTALDGISNWGVGDVAAFNGTTWQRIEGGADLNGVNLSVSGTSTLSGPVNMTTSDLVVGTAGKGVDFSANTNAPGMTSEKLTWYEEGNWTPVLRGATTAGTYETAAVSGRYTRVGRQVTIQCYMELANVITGGGSGYAQITGLPFAKAADTTFPTGALFTKGVDWTAGTPIVAPITSGSTSTLYFPEIIDNAPNNNIDISGFSAQDIIAFTLTYNV
jgi:hypothetical protein